jgi:hypothetical protein
MFSTPMRRIVSLLAILGVAIAVSNNDVVSHKAAIAESPAPVEQIKQLFLDTASGIRKLQSIVTTNAVQCVADQGIDVSGVDASASARPTSLDLMSWATESDIKGFETDGLGIWRYLDDVSDRNTNAPSQTSEAFNRAFLGDSSQRWTSRSGFEVASDGCLAQARLAVFGTFENFATIDQFATTIASGARTRILGGSLFASLQSDWTACMKKDGYEFTSMFDLGNYAHTNIYSGDKYSPAAKDAELALGRIHASCLRSIDYLTRSVEISDNGVAEAMRTSNDEIAQVADLVQKALAAVK